MIFSVGQRVRVINSTQCKYLIGSLGTVIGPPRSCQRTRTFLFWKRTRRWVGQPVDVDGIGHEIPDPEAPGGTMLYVPQMANLQPLDDGDENLQHETWAETQEKLKWSPNETKICDSTLRTKDHKSC